MKKMLRKFFCKHKWEEKERFFRPGRTLSLDRFRGTQEDLDELFNKCSPLTTIIYKCSLCQKPSVVEISGE